MDGSVVWSVVIPAYDEAERLPAYLRDVVAFFERRGEPYEVIVVDDGSWDATRERVRTLQAAHDRLRLIALPQNRGKGYAVRVGMVNARGAFRLFADADGATPIGELERLLPALRAGADVVIGSRALPDRAVAECVGPDELTPEYIIPSVFNKKVVPAVARAVVRAAQQTGVAQRRRRIELPPSF